MLYFSSDAFVACQVSQLHVHITLRIPSDPSWPGPCYGALPATPYTDDALTLLLAKLRAAF
jgi:diadenosine tetraphosphate (Ap4A) HIT family hydrolase